MIQGGSDVQPRPTREDGGPPPLQHIGDRRLRALLEIGQGRLVGDVEDIEQVVRDASTLGDGQLVGPDVHASVELHGIGIDDLAIEGLGEIEREIGLAGRRGADDRDNLGDHSSSRSGSSRSGSSCPKGSGPSPGTHVRSGTPHPSALMALRAFFFHFSPSRST